MVEVMCGQIADGSRRPVHDSWPCHTTLDAVVSHKIGVLIHAQMGIDETTWKKSD